MDVSVRVRLDGADNGMTARNVDAQSGAAVTDSEAISVGSDEGSTKRRQEPHGEQKIRRKRVDVYTCEGLHSRERSMVE